jgi:hypothetical protein
MSGRLETILGPIYGRMSFNDPETGESRDIWHKRLYDRKLLTDLLAEAGYVNAREWDWRKTEHSEIDDHSQAYFPHMDKENGIQVSLNIEADKPL